MKVLLLAAGKGTLGKSNVSKPLGEVNGKPMITLIVNKLRNVLKDTQIVVVVNEDNKKVIEDALSKRKNISYVVQQKALGTADALRIGLDKIGKDEDLLVMYADTVLIREASLAGIVSTHKLKECDATLLTGLTEKQYPYALVERNKESKIKSVIDHKTPDYPSPWEYYIGPVIVNSELARKYISQVEKDKESGEYYISNLLNILIKNGAKVESFRTLDETEYLGINNEEDLKVAEEQLIKRKIENLGVNEERFIRFGTGGWRARIGRGFTSRNVRKVVYGIAEYIIDNGLSKKGIVVGYDNRFLSEEFAVIACEVMAANNIKVWMSNKSVPTPVVTFTVLEKKAGGGIVFTASHNPANYNGIKFETQDGLPSPDYITGYIQKIANSINAEHIPWVSFSKGVERGYIRSEAFHNPYLDYLEEKIDYDSIKKANLKICFDPMFGAGTSTLQMALVSARCDLVTIHSERDPLFGGKSPAPSEEALSRLIQYMKENNFNVGIAVDGDADRIALVDENGRYISANEVILLAYYYLKKEKNMNGGVVRNIATTHNLDLLCDLFGERLYEVPVGFKHIAKSMIENDLLIGGESSGGVTFRDHIPEKDGIYTAMIIIEMLAKTNKTLSIIFNEIKTKLGKYYHYAEDNLELSPELEIKAERFVESPPEEISGKKIVKIDRKDGLKLYFENDSWLLLRFSGTEPLLRITSEAPDPEEAAENIEKIKKHLIS